MLIICINHSLVTQDLGFSNYQLWHTSPTFCAVIRAAIYVQEEKGDASVEACGEILLHQYILKQAVKSLDKCLPGRLI